MKVAQCEVLGLVVFRRALRPGWDDRKDSLFRSSTVNVHRSSLAGRAVLNHSDPALRTGLLSFCSDGITLSCVQDSPYVDEGAGYRATLIVPSGTVAALRSSRWFEAEARCQ